MPNSLCEIHKTRCKGSQNMSHSLTFQHAKMVHFWFILPPSLSLFAPVFTPPKHYIIDYQCFNSTPSDILNNQHALSTQQGVSPQVMSGEVGVTQINRYLRENRSFPPWHPILQALTTACVGNQPGREMGSSHLQTFITVSVYNS